MVINMEPDILYAIRQGERNEALKLSLRSLSNLPHRRVFLAGYCPAWVRGVTYIPVRRRANKFDAIEENVRKGLSHPEISSAIVYMNDDFYITKAVSEVPVMHGGLITQYAGKQELKLRMRRTTTELRFLFPEGDLFTYDGIHVPLPLDKDLAIKSLESIKRACLWRTWYGNLVCLGGKEVLDAKARGALEQESLPTFLSTGYKGLQALREQLEDTLPKRSDYVW